MHTLCNTLQIESDKIWTNIRDAFLLGSPYDEETITNNLLLNIQRNHPQEMIVVPFNKRQENVIGADWEWWLTDGTLWFGALVQAKILDQTSHKYKHFRYKDGKTGIFQIKKLIENSALRGLSPAYVFYNYTPLQLDFMTNRCANCKISVWGCSIASAHRLRSIWPSRAIGIPKIGPFSVPLHCAFCSTQGAFRADSFPKRMEAILSSSIADRLTTVANPMIVARKNPPDYVRRVLESSSEQRRKIIMDAAKEIPNTKFLVITSSRPIGST